MADALTGTGTAMSTVAGGGSASPEWKAVEKKLRSQPLPVAGRFFAWLTDGRSDEHRAFLTQTVPAPVVAVMSKVFGRRYHREVAPTWH